MSRGWQNFSPFPRRPQKSRCVTTAAFVCLLVFTSSSEIVIQRNGRLVVVISR